MSKSRLVQGPDRTSKPTSEGFNSPTKRQYRSEMVELLLSLKDKPPERTFKNADELLKYLNKD